MANSPHEDILTLAKTRLAGLDLDGVEDRIEEREVLAQGWTAAIEVYPILVISGVGLRTDLGPTNCGDDDEYPLTIRYVVRDPVWSIEERNTQQKHVHTIIQAFRHVKFTMTFSGCQCLDVILLPAVTIEEEPLAFQLVSRPMPFGVRVRQSR